MVTFFDLGGKKRPLLYGSAAFKLLKREMGITMSDFLNQLSSGEPDVISDITYFALRIGERHEKIPAAEIEDYEPLDVAMWMDEYPGGAAVFMQHIVDALPKPVDGEGQDEPGEAPQTGTGTNLKLQQGD